MNDKKIEPKIEARILKGFRDYLPQEAIKRNQLIKTISNLFEQHGFSPIDTPALEYSEILVGKGSEETDKQMFRFKDQGDRDVSMRFDLTVPLARFVSQHQNNLVFPFKRFHIAPVWRAEKPQKGRYREFIQCDFDIIGSSSYLSDLEVLSLVHSFFSQLKKGYRVRINHRGILNSIIKEYTPSEETTNALRVLDKLEKIGPDNTVKELILDAGLEETKAKSLVSLLDMLKNASSNEDRLNIISTKIKPSELLNNSIINIKKTLDSLGDYSQNTVLDVSIARGLDYYTGIVFETQLIDLPTIGSVCSGGRYDNLTSKFTSRSLQGVGGSIGLDRLLAAYEELEWHSDKDTRQGILIAAISEDDIAYSREIAKDLREKGLICELAVEISKIGHHYKYADTNKRKFAIIIGETERESETFSVKDFSISDKEKATTKVSKNDLLDFLK